MHEPLEFLAKSSFFVACPVLLVWLLGLTH